MSLFDKVLKFEQLCNTMLRKAQSIDPTKPFRFNTVIPPASLSGPTPRFSVPTRVEPAEPAPPAPKASPPKPVAQPKLNIPDQFIKDFANKLINFDPAQWEGVSVDQAELKKAGLSLNDAVANKQISVILKALGDILKATRNGGGPIYGIAQRIYNSVQQAMPKTPAKPKDDFLDRYMKEQKMKEWADGQMQAMEAQKNMPSSVQETLDRTNTNEYDPKLGF